MAEELLVSNGNKREKYEALLPQVVSMVKAETDMIANMANVCAMLKATFGFWWVGFYRVMGNQLVLGPCQGPLACTRIAFGQGVCGTAWKESRTVVVKDVDKFPGHIACSSESRSEIVVPVNKNGEIVAVLDIDSERLSEFDDVDAHYLAAFCDLL